MKTGIKVSTNFYLENNTEYIEENEKEKKI